MTPKKNLAVLFAATLAVLLTVSAVALAAPGPTVSVRIEGKTRTLLLPTAVHTHSGSITKGGAPKGACPATSAAGALQAATGGHWSGKFFSSFGDYEIKTIFAETESTTSYYWGIWIDNRYATTGACGIKLHPHQRLLFAVDSVAHHEHPLYLSAPHHAAVGGSFTVKLVWFSDAGLATPLAGAHITGGGVSATTDKHGIARITRHQAGSLVLHADHSGYIRAAPVSVNVSA